MTSELEIAFTPISKPDTHSLEYPFSFIYDSLNCDTEDPYMANDFCRGIPGEEPCDPGDFPNNIEEYYWIEEGENDERPWLCLCKLKNGVYAYYTAHCDYTGFECQGGMTLTVSRSAERLFYEGMTEKERWNCVYLKRK